MKKIRMPLLITFLILSTMTLLIWQISQQRLRPHSTNGYSPVNVLLSLERNWYDTRFRLKSNEQASNVLVAKIDDASLERFGRWPWARSVYKEIIHYLFELGARVVAFDAVFAEPEFQSAYLHEVLSTQNAGRELSLQEELKLSPNAVQTLSETLPTIGDQIFAGALKSYPNTVLGYIWQGREACKIYDPMNSTHVKLMGKMDRVATAQKGMTHVENLIDDLGTLTRQSFGAENSKSFDSGSQTLFPLGNCPLTNRSTLSTYANYQGFFNALPDMDGLFRRALLIYGFQSDIVPQDNRDFLPPEWFQRSTFFPSLVLESLKAYLGNDTQMSPELTSNSQGQQILTGIRIHDSQKDLILPVQADGTLLLNFYGTQALQKRSQRPFGEFSLGNIQGDLNDKEFQRAYGLNPLKPLENQIVLIGPTALGVYDLRPTPAQSDGAGVYLHATALARLLKFVRGEASQVQINWSPLWLSLAILWIIGLSLGLYLAQARVASGLIATLSVVGLIFGIDLLLFNKFWIALDTMSLLQSTLLIFTALFVYKYFTEEKDRVFVKRAFSRYVSPDVVDSILEDPKKLNLGGQRQHLSVLFSDVRGFTTISEKMSAAELGKFMNDYLSPMTDVILAERGTIDKYMGDAIMAIFGAPLRYENHAEAAAHAGLKMLAKLEELKLEWAARNLPQVDIGIGINTGEMSVGNMGSTRIFSYTVMGDSVNLGSRLEGITKEYGVKFIVSEFTRRELGPDFVCRELDRVKVKGKLKPVTIFEVQAFGAHPELRNLCSRFEAALQRYYARDFLGAKEDFVELSKIKSSAKNNNACVEMYIQRCELWLKSPPAPDWDGSWTMTTK